MCTPGDHAYDADWCLQSDLIFPISVFRCPDHDLFAEYEAIRGTDAQPGQPRAALRQSELLPIGVNSSEQPCANNFDIIPCNTFF